MAKFWIFNELIQIISIARKINLKQTCFSEIVNILSLYQIMPVNSPNMDFTHESSAKDKSQLRDLRKICQIRLHEIDYHNKMIKSNDTSNDIITLNGGGTKDSFEMLIFNSNKQSLRIIEEKLSGCVIKIGNLKYLM